MKTYREVKSSERLPNFKNRKKFTINRYDDGSTDIGISVPDANEPYEYWLEEIKDE